MNAAEKERALLDPTPAPHGPGSLHAPKAMSDLVAKSLASLSGPIRSCPHCGTPYRVFPSANRTEIEHTWTVPVSEDGTIPAPEHTIILECKRVTLTIQGRVSTHEHVLESDSMHVDDTQILTASDHAQPGTPATITALLSVPTILCAFPRDRCCPTHARDLGQRFAKTKGETDDSKEARAEGRALVNWAFAREQEILAEERRQPNLGLEGLEESNFQANQFTRT